MTQSPRHRRLFWGEGAANFRLSAFSFIANHDEGRFLYRVNPYAYWHPTDFLDIHLEGQGYGYTGGSQYSGRDSLYQGFVEARFPDKNTVSLKAGRQEFIYGSTFILGSNSFYDGLVFDALRLRLQPADSLNLDLLGGFYGSPFATGLKGNLAGIYATYRLSNDNAIEAYGFRDTGTQDNQGREPLDIFGLRWTVKEGPVSVEFEPVYETGRVFNPANGGSNSVTAYGGHLDLGVATNLGGHNANFTAGYALGSGDKKAAEGVGFGKEFRNPDNNTSLIGDMFVLSTLSGISVNNHHASGVHIFTLGGSYEVTKELVFNTTGHYFLADEVENGFSRGIGLETDFNLTYTISDDFSVIFAYDRFFTGGFFRDASGSRDDIQYGYVMLQFDISKTGLRAAGKR